MDMRNHRSVAALMPFALMACGNGPADGADNSVAAVPASVALNGQSAAAEPVKQRLPPEVAQWVAEMRATCREEGGTFKGVSDHYLTGDFNGDGRTDYILSEAGINCPHPDGRAEGAIGGFGRAGPPNHFLISGPNGYRMAGGFSSLLEQRNVQRRGKADVVVLDHGFNGAGGAIAKVVWGWDGTKVDLLERYGEKGERVDREGYPLAPGERPALSLPIRQGDYVMASESCTDPSSVTRFDGSRVHFLSAVAGESHVETIAGIDRAGNTYDVEFARPPGHGEDEMTGADNYMTVEVRSQTQIRVTIQDYSDKRFCPNESLPPAFRTQ